MLITFFFPPRDLFININIIALVFFGSDLFLSSIVWQYCSRIINYIFLMYPNIIFGKQ